MTTFLDRFHAILTGTDPRPLVGEVRGDEVLRLRRPELALRCARARAALARHGVRPGDRVVLLAANSIDWVAADLAILFEGAISVPLYPRQAADELADAVRDCAPSLVLAGDDVLAAKLLGEGVDVPVRTFEAVFAEGPRVAPPVPRRPGDVVTLVYTSGTSGPPKGARITAANVDHVLAATSARLTSLLGDDAPEERVYHLLPFCFMGSRIVLWTCIAREVELLAGQVPERLADELAAARPTWMLAVPLLLDRLKDGVEASVLERGWPAPALWRAALAAEHRREAPAWYDGLVLDTFDRMIRQPLLQRLAPELAFVVSGSALLSPGTWRWFAWIGIPVLQVYGLTETTAIVTMDDGDTASEDTVGVAIDGVRLRLGADDELLVAGPNVFDGYWNAPHATASAIEDGWLHTGDRVTLDPDGRVRLVGRASQRLVLASGHNVQPEPLEAALRDALPGAVDVVIVGHGRPHLVALVTGAVDDDAIRAATEALGQGAPAYRKVRAWTRREAPLTHEEGLLTANGKVRRAVVESAFADAFDALYARTA